MSLRLEPGLKGDEGGDPREVDIFLSVYLREERFRQRKRRHKALTWNTCGVVDEQEEKVGEWQEKDPVRSLDGSSTKNSRNCKLL